MKQTKTTVSKKNKPKQMLIDPLNIPPICNNKNVIVGEVGVRKVEIGEQYDNRKWKCIGFDPITKERIAISKKKAKK